MIIFICYSNLFLYMRVFRPSCDNAMFITEMYTSGKNRNNLRVQFAELRHTWKLLFLNVSSQQTCCHLHKIVGFQTREHNQGKTKKPVMPLSPLVCSILKLGLWVIGRSKLTPSQNESFCIWILNCYLKKNIVIHVILFYLTHQCFDKKSSQL